jgi:MFS family permease
MNGSIFPMGVSECWLPLRWRRIYWGILRPECCCSEGFAGTHHRVAFNLYALHDRWDIFAASSAFYLCAFAFSCIGGLVPSSVMGAAPFHTPSALLGTTNGLLVQGSSLGIVAGPPLMSLIATRFGWHWVPVMTGISAIIATVLAGNMRSAHTNPQVLPEQLVSD